VATLHPKKGKKTGGNGVLFCCSFLMPHLQWVLATLRQAKNQPAVLVAVFLYMKKTINLCHWWWCCCGGGIMHPAVLATFALPHCHQC